MANANRPTGLSPVKSGISPWNGQVNIYSIAAAYGTAIAVGDVVKSSGTASADGFAGVVAAAAGDTVRGVVVGVGTSPTLLANPNDLNTTISKANATYTQYVAVVDDPNAVFEVQAATCAAADVGGNADIVVGANNGFVSGTTLSGTIAAAAATCRVLGLVPRIDNDFGAYAKVLVKIMEHELTTAAGV